MWGESIVGFGDLSYTNTTKSEYKWFKTGFSPRKQSLTLYIMDGFESYDEILSRLGKHKTGKSCLYINLDSSIYCNKPLKKYFMRCEKIKSFARAMI